MDILKQLQIELGIKASQVENTVKLLDEGNTVPFIARYRKEVTGSLDDQIIRQLAERLTALRNLEEKREMAVSYTHLDVYKRQVHTHIQKAHGKGCEC